MRARTPLGGFRRWTKDHLSEPNPIRVMSKQTKTAHSAPSAVSGLTHSATGQGPEYRTKYEYDALGQVKCGKKYWADGTPVAGQQFEYAFDDIGNRTSHQGRRRRERRQPCGRQATLPTASTNTPAATCPPVLDVIGARASATDTVTGQRPVGLPQRRVLPRGDLAVNQQHRRRLAAASPVAANGTTATSTSNCIPAQDPEPFATTPTAT